MCVSSWHEPQSYALTFDSYLGQICAYPYFQSNICLDLLFSALNVRINQAYASPFLLVPSSRPKLYKQCSRVILNFYAAHSVEAHDWSCILAADIGVVVGHTEMWA
jgi:hypothetical protein